MPFKSDVMSIYTKVCEPFEGRKNDRWQINLTCLKQKGAIAENIDKDIIVALIGQHDAGGKHLITLNSCISGSEKCECNFKGTVSLRKFDDLTEAMDSYILGYPKSIQLDDSGRYVKYDFSEPLIRKGIVAGKDFKNKTIVVDCAVYPGNSGGPVFCYFNNIPNLIGMVIERIPFKQNVWDKENHKKDDNIWINSGYSIVIPIDFALDLISEIKSKIKKE